MLQLTIRGQSRCFGVTFTKIYSYTPASTQLMSLRGSRQWTCWAAVTELCPDTCSAAAFAQCWRWTWAGCCILGLSTDLSPSCEEMNDTTLQHNSSASKVKQNDCGTEMMTFGHQCMSCESPCPGTQRAFDTPAFARWCFGFGSSVIKTEILFAKFREEKNLYS